MALASQEFYSDQDLQQNATHMRRALLAPGLLSPLFLAAMVASLAARTQWLTVLATIGWGGFLLFWWDMKIAPIRAYRKHLAGILTGLRRTAEGTVISFSEEGTYKDGVFFDALIINGTSEMDPEGERLFYVDRCKPRPPLAPGDSVRITANGNYVIAWEK